MTITTPVTTPGEAPNGQTRLAAASRPAVPRVYLRWTALFIAVAIWRYRTVAGRE